MDKEHKAIERICTASQMSLHYYGMPLVCTYSGGKDSEVMLELFKRSGVPFEVHNSHTTADAPQTVLHIREVFRTLELNGIKCMVDYHIQPDGSRITMWNLIPRKLLPPTRKMRYCCSVLKESGCRNRMIATGVRWAESSSRKTRESFEVIGSSKKYAVAVSDEKMLLTDNDEHRKLFERCELKGSTAVNPIVDWTDSEIWDYYWKECPSHNPLYQMGYYRVGCIGCPMAGKNRWKEFADFPKIKNSYIRAFEKTIQARAEKGLDNQCRTGEELFLWWMEDRNIPGQMTLDFDGELKDEISDNG